MAGDRGHEAEAMIFACVNAGEDIAAAATYDMLLFSSFSSF